MKGRIHHQHNKKILWLLLPLLIVLYLAVGAVAPFISYKKMPEDAELHPELEAMIDRENKETVDRVMLLETNESAWEERLRFLNQARERIILSTFDMREGESTRDLFSLILEKADEGVNVKIVVDGFPGVVRMLGRPLFESIAAHPNIEIRHYNPINLLMPWKSQGRMHDKYVIVDDLGYILGGRNTFDYFIGNYDTKNKSFDREVLVYNSAHGTDAGKESSLKQVETYFDTIWNLDVTKPFAENHRLASGKKIREIRGELEGRLSNIKEAHSDLFEIANYIPVTYETEGICLLSNPTGIYGKQPEVFYQLMKLVEKAGQKTVIHTPYFVCNQYMEDTLKKVNDKIPDLKIVFNSIANGDNFFASSDYMRRKKHLVNLGIPMYEYDGGNSTHGKSLVIGSEIAVIGSYNMDLRSTYLDTELMLVIKSTKLTEELQQNMQKIEKDCRKVITSTEYEIKPDINVKKISPFRMIAMKIVGFVMQPVRFLI
ncbi:MAG: phospholipase D family protein [Clostridium sp.]